MREALEVETVMILTNIKNTGLPYKKIKQICQKEFYIKQCTKFKSNTKLLWKTINNVTKSKRDKSCIIDSIKYTKVCNEFGQFFSSIGEKIASKGGNSTKKIDYYFGKIPTTKNSVFLTPCTQLEI